MRIAIKMDEKLAFATVLDNEVARDFLSLLPLNLSINDLFGREKFGALPRALSEKGPRTAATKSVISHIGRQITILPFTTARMGFKTVARCYRHARIDSGVEAFNAPGSIMVTIELAG